MTASCSTHSQEIQEGTRFPFGHNWTRFIANLGEEQIRESQRALREMLQRETLDGLTFLDAGSGSGLSSLAARRLGAQVHSFDYDPASVGASQAVRDRFAPNDPLWHIEQGSLLDPAYLDGLPLFDIVYSWGVLHHTGSMWQAMEYLRSRVKPGGLLFIALYNDTGSSARNWRKVKKLYCSGTPGRWLVMTLFAPKEFLFPFIRDVARLRNPLRRYREYIRRRGMSRFHDWLDWLGGLPYEVAKPEHILHFFRPYGFHLLRLSTEKRIGNNQFVFRLDEPEHNRPAQETPSTGGD